MAGYLFSRICANRAHQLSELLVESNSRLSRTNMVSVYSACESEWDLLNEYNRRVSEIYSERDFLLCHHSDYSKINEWFEKNIQRNMLTYMGFRKDFIGHAQQLHKAPENS